MGYEISGPFHKEIQTPTKGAEFSTLHRGLNSAPLCIFSTLMHKSDENCFTNIHHPLTKKNYFVSNHVIG